MTEPNAAAEWELTYAEAAELAFRLRTQRRFKESEMVYRQLLNAEPNDQNVVQYLGVLLHRTGCHAEALELIERSLTADDTVAASYNKDGNVLLEAGRFNTAAAAYRRCTELDPCNVEVLCNLGVMYRGLKRFDEADELMLNKALAAQPYLVERAGFDVRELADVVLRFEVGRSAEGQLAVAEAARVDRRLSQSRTPIELEAN